MTNAQDIDLAVRLLEKKRHEKQSFKFEEEMLIQRENAIREETKKEMMHSLKYCAISILTCGGTLAIIIGTLIMWVTGLN